MPSSSSSSEKSSDVNLRPERHHYLDYARVLGCLMVLMIHSCDPFYSSLNVSQEGFATGLFGACLLRPCVPIFALVTGALLLPVKQPLLTFHKSRFKRLFYPIAFWGIVAPLCYFVYLTYVSPKTYTLGPDILAWSDVWPSLYTWIFNFSYYIIPFWYLYMLMGIYMILPVISDWFNKATQKEVLWLLLLWFASTFLWGLQYVAPLLGYQGIFGEMKFLGECSWNEFGTFYYVSGFLGYVILGFYLHKFQVPTTIFKQRIFGILLYIIGSAITVMITFQTPVLIESNHGIVTAETYYFLENAWGFNSFNTVIQSLGIYLILRTLNYRTPKWIVTFSIASFGIYLVHFMFIRISYEILEPVFTYLNTPIRIVSICALTLFLSLIVVLPIRKIKILKRFVE